jgi:hypothetical protein
MLQAWLKQSEGMLDGSAPGLPNSRSLSRKAPHLLCLAVELSSRLSMSQRSFHDHSYLELLKSSRTSESTLARHVLDAHQPDRTNEAFAPSENTAKSRRHLSDSVDFCVSLLTELYFENTQVQPSNALLALWRRQSLDILFRCNP